MLLRSKYCYSVLVLLVRDWKRKQEKLKVLPKNKCADRGKPCLWPDLEREVRNWIDNQRQSGYIVTRNLIRLQARSYASVGWLNWFMKRNGLVLRQKTKISQKLPHDFENKIISFHSFVINQRKKRRLWSLKYWKHWWNSSLVWHANFQNRNKPWGEKRPNQDNRAQEDKIHCCPFMYGRWDKAETQGHL